jgi:hypothetical protein
MTTERDNEPYAINTLEPGESMVHLPGPVGGEIYQRLAQIMAEVPAIAKDQKNQQQGYAFRGIDDLFNALHSLFAKHEVVVLPEVLRAEYVQQLAGSNQNLATDARLLIRYNFVTTDGSSASMTVQGESRDYADKATGQAMSAGYKIGLLEMFLIPLEETRDADSQSPTIEDPLTLEEVEERAEVAAKMQLVEILGSNTAAATFWETHQGMNHAEIVEAAIQVKADDTEAGDATEDPEAKVWNDQAYQKLVEGKVPARKTQLQQGINDMAVTGGKEDFVAALIEAGSVLLDLSVADLKVLYLALQQELMTDG